MKKMKKITVRIQPTNKETIIKFIHTATTTNGSYEYTNIDETQNSPIAQQLFQLPFVKRVFISANFIAIERYEIVSWEDVQQEVCEQIENYLNSGGIIILDGIKSSKKIAIEIYLESTPNPSVMKYVANKMLVSQAFEFKNIDEAKDAPMAVALFQLPFVKEVFISDNYISVTKYDIADWQDVAQEVRSFIREYIADGNSIVNEKIIVSKEETSKKEESIKKEEIKVENLDNVSQQIIAILEEYVKPAVASDGGNILFDSYNKETKTVSVILQGACSGCPSSTLTLKNGIENMLKEMIPNKIDSVIALNG